MNMIQQVTACLKYDLAIIAKPILLKQKLCLNVNGAHQSMTTAKPWSEGRYK